jgi:ATP-dependent Lon protease
MTDFEHIDIPDVLPLLPVRDIVMYTSVLLPLLVGRDMSINAV